MNLEKIHEIVKFIELAISQHDFARIQLLSITVPIPEVKTTDFLRMSPLKESFLWDRSSDDVFAGKGAVRTIRVDGRGRLLQLRSESQKLWSQIQVTGFPETTHYVPRLFGGVSFEANSGGSEWQNFGDSLFILPRFLYRKHKSGVDFTVTVEAEDLRDQAVKQRLLELIQEQLHGIFRVHKEAQNLIAAKLSAKAEKNSSVQVLQLEFSKWRAHLNQIKSAILAGEYRKIVAARVARMQLPKDFDVLSVLDELETSEGNTRFCISPNGDSFLGLTPERLFAKEGRTLHTQALAGTSLNQHEHESTNERLLLNSEKDREEQDYVVQAILQSLTKISDQVIVEKAPQIRKAGHLTHLNTEISAKLRPDIDAIEALQTMHPTPAVGGMPVRGASRWITENEPFARGWYSGCVGWIDAAHDGEFVVAIRCALIRKSEGLVYAGAGIVEASDPLCEYQETALKQLTMMRALGMEVVVN